jgi:murein DD-endopeptidase MepM/ murein hydrolase activator NlpD
MRRLFAPILLLMISTPVFAQRTVTLSERDIPRQVVDTLPTDRDEVRIVTYSDGTFRFIPTNMYHFLSAPAYEANWDTINLWAYRKIPLSDLPDRIMVEMAESHGFSMPAEGRVISRYGRRNGRDHNGIDIRVAQGQPVYAAFDGVVRLSRWNAGGFGNLIIIRHANGLETYYSHLSRRAVVAAEWVRAGQVIGYGGQTGRASAPHLHFETRYFDNHFDPEWIIDFERCELPSRMFALLKNHFSISSRARDPLPVPAADSLARNTLAERVPVE